MEKLSAGSSKTPISTAPVAVFNGVLGVVSKDVKVDDSEQIPNTFKDGDTLVSKCSVTANFDNVCVESCPLDDYGL